MQQQLVQLSSCFDQLSGRIERSRNQPEEDCLGNNSEVEVEQELARRDIVKLNPYDGESEVEIFLHLVKVCQHHNHWTDAQTKGHMEVALKGKAAEVLMAPDSDTRSLEDLMKKCNVVVPIEDAVEVEEETGGVEELLEGGRPRRETKRPAYLQDFST